MRRTTIRGRVLAACSSFSEPWNHIEANQPRNNVRVEQEHARGRRLRQRNAKTVYSKSRCDRKIASGIGTVSFA
jgi:hypothetical protein